MIKEIEKMPKWENSPHKYRLELARIKPPGFYDQGLGHKFYFDFYCRFFPEILQRAQDCKVELVYNSYTSINYDTLTVIEAQGSIGKLTSFDDYSTRTFLDQYDSLLKNATRHLFIVSNPNMDAYTDPEFYEAVKEFCPYKVTCKDVQHSRSVLEGQIVHPWSRWENGYRFRNRDDMVLALMLL